MNIAIIGAGLSGANLYRLLSQNNEVTVFEKARGTGGRCSTKYIKDKYIDHGTPYFEAKDSSFIEFCDRKIKEDILYKEDGYFIPKKGINKFCSSMIDIDDIVKNCKIKSCSFEDNKWKLKDENNIKYGSFDKLIITIPAPQILDLDIIISDDLKSKLSKVTYDSIATVIAYTYTSKNLMNPKLLDSGIFRKIVDNSKKYSYTNFSSYVLHLDENITAQQNFQNKEEVYDFIVDSVYKISGVKLDKDFYIIPHLWRYAIAKNKINEEFLYDDNLSLGICGDYFKYDNLEGAFLSSNILYEKKLKRI